MTDKDNIRCYRFVFEATIGKLLLAVKFGCSIKLIWKRSNEVATIEPIPLENGVINFNRKLSLNVNMYFDTVSKLFLQKKCVFSLILVTPKGQKSAGAVTLDLAAKVNQHIEEYEAVYPLEKCPVSGSSLEIAITSKIMAEAQLDSMSQMTSAQQTIVDTSAVLETSVVGEISTISHFSRPEDVAVDAKSTTSSAKTGANNTDLLNFEGSAAMTDNILKMNDTTTKISQFIGQFGQSIRKELERLRENNKSLQSELAKQKQSKEQLKEQLGKAKLEANNLRADLELSNQKNETISSTHQANYSQLQEKLAAAESMKASLESSNMAGDQQKMLYMSQLKKQQQDSERRHAEDKKRLEDLLKQEQEQVYSLKSSNSALSNELKQTKDSLDQVTTAKRELQAERTDNEQQVEAARLRLERVYSEMLSALQGVI